MQYFVYILTNTNNKVMYIVITNNLERRVYEHKNGVVEGFTKKYRVHKSVYCEVTDNVKEAIIREKQIKGWTRAKKNALVTEPNPSWRDISEGWYGDSSLRSE